MNVIVIALDTLRWDALGCYRDDWVRTPCLDAFAKRATIFERAYCASFPTIPMRTDCFTGNVNFPRYGWTALRDDEILLTEVMRDAGYYTGFVTDTTNMIPMGFERGFHDVHVIKAPPENTTKPEDIPFDVPSENMRGDGKSYQRDMAQQTHFRHESDWFVARTMNTACDWLQDHGEKKFFLWVDSFEIHEVWHAPDYYVDLYSRNYKGLDYKYPNYGYTDCYKPSEIKRLRAHYAAEVTLTDRWVGHLLRQVELMGLFDNTMVVVISDHGMAIGEHKRAGKHTVDYDDPWPMFEEVTHIPLLVWVPKKGMKKRVKALAQPADIMATIADVCRIKTHKVHGKSWLPLLMGRKRRNWEYVFTSRNNWGYPGASRATVTSERWTYMVAEHGFPGMLFDLKSDPSQSRNVMKTHPNVVKKMHGAFLEFMRWSRAEDGYIAKYDVL
ncbi:MAG: sulfatase-like hydrolase/transferase [Planctomycetes bacterium]|nr:sulfatase-like hydrolase/transferase [Planctomycetota bacterium]